MRERPDMMPTLYRTGPFEWLHRGQDQTGHRFCGRAPIWWRRLTRSRWAAHDLVTDPAIPLAGYALTHGNADTKRMVYPNRIGDAFL